jgi:hypothetical protein
LTFDNTYLPPWGSVNKSYYISGKLEQLDYGNEWYYGGNNTLYIKMPTGNSPANHTVEFKARKNAFNLGTKQFININGLKIFAATIDAGQASNCILDGLDAKYVSYYVRTTDESGKENSDNSGIILGGSGNTFKNSIVIYSPGALLLIKGTGNKVYNNLLHDGAYGPS